MRHDVRRLLLRLQALSILHGSPLSHEPNLGAGANDDRQLLHKDHLCRLCERVRHGVRRLLLRLQALPILHGAPLSDEPNLYAGPNQRGQLLHQDSVR